jgi:membrane fusion protein, multidrug efflux system
LLTLGLPLTLIISCTRPVAPTPPVPQVAVAQPQELTVTNWDEYPGHLESVEMVEVQARVTGYIQSIHFEDGTDVQAGDLLFVIDPQPYQAELERARAERERAEARLDLTRNDLKRAEGLRGTRAISEEEYDARHKAMLEAKAALASVRAMETNAQINLSYTRVLAPIRGQIGRRLITVGNLVQGAGVPTLLTTIVSQDPVYCYFDVEEGAFLRYLKDGATRKKGGKALNIECELSLQGESGFPHKGQIDFFDNRVDRQMGSIRVRGVLANPDRNLVPGFFANVRIPAGSVEKALLIPEIALQPDQDRKFVYVVNAESVVEPRPVVLGRSHGPSRSILQGLKPQDRVVISGLLMIRPGAKVQVIGNAAGTAVAQASAAK